MSDAAAPEPTLPPTPAPTSTPTDLPKDAAHRLNINQNCSSANASTPSAPRALSTDASNPLASGNTCSA